MTDINSIVAGWLRDLAFIQKSPQSGVINCWPLARLLDWAQSRSQAA